MRHRTSQKAITAANAAQDRLNEAGWFFTVSTIIGFDGLVTWIVSGTDGVNLIRVDGASREEAWISAFEQTQRLVFLEGNA